MPGAENGNVGEHYTMACLLALYIRLGNDRNSIELSSLPHFIDANPFEINTRAVSIPGGNILPFACAVFIDNIGGTKISWRKPEKAR